MALVRGRSARGLEVCCDDALGRGTVRRVFENEQAGPDLRMVKLRREVRAARRPRISRTMRRSVPYLRIRSLWVDLTVDDEHAGACLTV